MIAMVVLALVPAVVALISAVAAWLKADAAARHAAAAREAAASMSPRKPNNGSELRSQNGTGK